MNFQYGHTALTSQKKYTLDEKINYDGYSPKNVDNKNYGYISVQDIVAKSLNIPTVKIAEKLSIVKCKKYGEECGIIISNMLPHRINFTAYSLHRLLKIWFN